MEIEPTLTHGQGLEGEDESVESLCIFLGKGVLSFRGKSQKGAGGQRRGRSRDVGRGKEDKALADLRASARNSWWAVG